MGEQKRERLDDYEQGAWVRRVLTVAVVAAVATAAAVGVSLIWPGGIQAHVTECGLNARGPFAVVDLHNDSGSAFDAYMWIEFRVDGELVDRTLFVLDGYFPPGDGGEAAAGNALALMCELAPSAGRARHARTLGHERVLPEGKTWRTRIQPVPLMAR